MELVIALWRTFLTKTWNFLRNLFSILSKCIGLKNIFLGLSYTVGDIFYGGWLYQCGEPWRPKQELLEVLRSRCSPLCHLALVFQVCQSGGNICFAAFYNNVENHFSKNRISWNFQEKFVLHFVKMYRFEKHFPEGVIVWVTYILELGISMWRTIKEKILLFSILLSCIGFSRFARLEVIYVLQLITTMWRTILAKTLFFGIFKKNMFSILFKCIGLKNILLGLS